MSDFQQALANWQAAATAFIKVIEAVPEELRKKSGVCGVWNCQQVIAHLAGWQREALKRYQDFLEGDTVSITYDLDAYNASSVAALKLLNWYETLDTFKFTFDDLNRLATTLTSQQVEQNPLYTEWLIGVGDDLVTHTAEIEQWLAAQRIKT